jgi:hypothetical protein
MLVLRLTPKTKRAKQLISQGLGQIVGVADGPRSVQCFHGQPGMLVFPIDVGPDGVTRNAVFKAPRDWCSRWLRANNDPDFDFVEIPGGALASLLQPEN